MERITFVVRQFTLRGPSHKEGFVQLFVSKRLIQGLAAGLLAMLGLTMMFSVEWTFIIGAVASLFFNMTYLASHD